MDSRPVEAEPAAIRLHPRPAGALAAGVDSLPNLADPGARIGGELGPEVLVGANIKLESVAINVVGVSARAMLEGMIAGSSIPEELVG